MRNGAHSCAFRALLSEARLYGDGQAFTFILDEYVCDAPADRQQ